MAFPVLPVLLIGGIVLFAVAAKKEKKPEPEPKPPDKTCPEGQAWAPAEGKCVPMPDPTRLQVGDIVTQGMVGPVGWRVVFAESTPLIGGGHKNVFITQFIDPTSPVEMDRKWFDWGWGFEDPNKAIDEALRIAAERPWLNG